MNLCNLLNNFGIESFAATDVSGCGVVNARLMNDIPADAQAVFVVIPYYVGGETKGGRLARFASVPDYHVFTRTLFSAAETYLLEKYPGTYIRGFADHSPLDERRGAVRAGLGIVGRHGLLITEKYSSFVCIGELICSLTRAELADEGIPYRTEDAHMCEDCGLCAANCPANCIERGTRDLCVAALTQKKETLTDEEQRIIQKSGYVWGCDLCQLACPHTQKALRERTLETPIEYFRKGFLSGMDADRLNAMSDEEFAAYSFSWRRREVLARNIRIMKELGKE